jgi:VWFA-related protein
MRFRTIPVVMAFLAFVPVGLGAQGQASPPTSPAPPPAPNAGPQTPAVIPVTVNLVNVLFTVLNARNKMVTDLTQKDFQVMDDNKPQDILFFSRQNDLPLRVGVLLDTSNSIRERLQFEQEAAVDFLYNVVRKNQDQVFLMSVDDSPEITQDFTGDLDRLRNSINRQRAGGGTALYDAVYTAAEHLAKAMPEPQSGGQLDSRGVLVVISDGDDNVSRHSRREALEMAQHAGIVIYTISTSTNWILTDKETNDANAADRKYFKDEGDKLLQQFADDSGGRAFFPYHIDDLAKSFENISDELRSEYSLAFAPANRTPDGKFHNIRIQVSTKGLKVQARKGYFADPPKSAAGAAPDKPANSN